MDKNNILNYIFIVYILTRTKRWVKLLGPEQLDDRDCRGILTRMFMPREVDSSIAHTCAAEERNELLPNRMTVPYIMAPSMFSSGPDKEFICSMLVGVEWFTVRFKVRTLLGISVTTDLLDTCANPVDRAGEPDFLRNCRLVRIDGAFPETPANKRTYVLPGSNTEAKCAIPQARQLGPVESSTLVVVLSPVVFGCDTAEQTMYTGLLCKLEDYLSVIADSRFFSYTAFKETPDTGAQLLWRMIGNAVLPVHEEIADAKQRWHNMNPIPVCVVKCTVTTGKETGEFRLVTSTQVPVAVPADNLTEAYAQRREIEFILGDLKIQRRIAAVVLRSETANRVIQQIHVHLCVRYALRSPIGKEVAHDLDEESLHIPSTQRGRVSQRSIAARPAFSP